MDQVNYLSAEGLEKLMQELKELKTVKRREMAAKIEAAKALGDLSENAEYHDAKEELAMVEKRIYDINDILHNVAMIEEERGSKDIAHIGSVVGVTMHGKPKTFTIVGSSEAEPAIGKISNESPLGNALLGAMAGQTVEVRTPAGVTEYKIISVS